MEEKQTKKEVQEKVQKEEQKKTQTAKKKGMKKNEKIVIAILLIITIILIVVACVRNSNSNEENVIETASSNTSEEETLEDEEGYVTTLSDGTKLNTSEKLNEDKEIDGIEITEIQLTEDNNITQLLATLTNTSDETQGGYSVTITLLDEDGEEIVELKTYIPELEAGESTQLNTSAVFDYVEAYDFTISK